MENKFFEISMLKEQKDTHSLLKSIEQDKWINSSTIIVNCFPEYSSRLSQSINHGLSHLNKNELFEQINLNMPYPKYKQVWNDTTKNYESYDTYLKNWINENIYANQFLFVYAGVMDGRDLNKLKLSLRNKMENVLFRFASLYVEETSIITPDYYAETFDKTKHGGLLFDWENSKNPNWDY